MRRGFALKATGTPRSRESGDGVSVCHKTRSSPAAQTPMAVRSTPTTTLQISVFMVSCERR